MRRGDFGNFSGRDIDVPACWHDDPYDEGMIQLALVGPPAESRQASGRQRLHQIVHEALFAHLTGTGIDPLQIDGAADAVVDRLARRPQRITARKMLHLIAGGRPHCWICGQAIPPDAKPDSYAAFSIDHVVPLSEGGAELGFPNMRPAHRICNNIRCQPRLKKRTRLKYEAFLQSLRASETPAPSTPPVAARSPFPV